MRLPCLGTALVTAALWYGCSGPAPTAPASLINGAASPGSPAPAPSPSPSPTTYLYSGIVRDGVGQPVAGAIVEAGPDSGVTDSRGRYEFRSPYESAAGRVRPPDGYEPNPKRLYESMPIASGGQDLTVRRIARLAITGPATLAVGARDNIGIEVTFDTGAREYPYIDAVTMTSTNAAVVKAVGGAPGPAIEGVGVGTAQVTAAYRGAQSAGLTVQVVAR